MRNGGVQVWQHLATAISCKMLIYLYEYVYRDAHCSILIGQPYIYISILLYHLNLNIYIYYIILYYIKLYHIILYYIILYYITSNLNFLKCLEKMKHVLYHMRLRMAPVIQIDLAKKVWNFWAMPYQSPSLWAMPYQKRVNALILPFGDQIWQLKSIAMWLCVHSLILVLALMFLLDNVKDICTFTSSYPIQSSIFGTFGSP